MPGASVGGAEAAEGARAENARLKRMYANLALENAGDQGRVEPEAVTPSAKQEVLAVLVHEHQLPVRRAGQAVRLSRTAYYRYRPPRSWLRRTPLSSPR